MGLFGHGKCPIHGKPYKLAKDYMCQLYKYCPDCYRQAKKNKELEERVKRLERLTNKQ